MRKRRWLLLLAFAGLVGASSCSRKSLTPPRLAAPGQATLSVLTYNVNYGLAGDLPTVAAIAEHPADVVLLQETTPAWEEVLRARFQREYAHMAFRHCCLAGGLGVLSKYPFEELEYIEPPDGGWFPAWRLGVESPVGKIQVLNVHLRPQIGDSGPNIVGIASGQFTTPAIRKEQIATYAAHLEPGIPTVIAGDFNESESGRALSWLEARGLHSVAPDFTDDETWSWNTSFGRVSRRFDHIVHSPHLNALTAGVLDAGNSDHRPVYAVLELADAPGQAPR